MGRTIVGGDIHGGFKGLKQCLGLCEFDYDNDTFIQIGDITDGWSEVYECVEELMKIKNLILIKGNHDSWLDEYLDGGSHGSQWTQGGESTRKSYMKVDENGDLKLTIPTSHRKFFESQKLYYIDDKNRLFVHGGFNRRKHILEETQPYMFYWDRDLWLEALSYEGTKRGSDNVGKFKIVDDFSEIFIGHTPTINWGTDQPMKAANIWNIDTGAAYTGRLTVMDVDTKEYWQSELLIKLYDGERGRN